MSSKRTIKCNSLHLHFISLVIVTSFVTFVAFLLTQNLANKTYPNEDILVHWRPSLNDNNVAVLLGRQERENSFRPLILVPTRFTGSDFFSYAIQSGISLQGINVQTVDLTNIKLGEKSRPDQHRRLGAILRNRPAEKLVFIESNVLDIGFSEQTAHWKTFQLPYMVILLRDPVEVLLSNYHHKIYGSRLFLNSINMTSESFKERVAKLTRKFENCVHGNHDCAKGLTGSSLMLKALSALPISKSLTLKEWGNRALRAAKYNINTRGILIGVMDDFKDLPFMFEQVAPRICKNLEMVIEMIKAPFWTEHPLNISNITRNIIMKNDVMLRYEYQLYKFAKRKYYKLKQNSFMEVKKQVTVLAENSSIS